MQLNSIPLQIAATVAWLVGLALLCTPIYVTYDFLREGGGLWGESEWVAYDILARPSFALGLSWVIFACHTGYGGKSFVTVRRPMEFLVYH